MSDDRVFSKEVLEDAWIKTELVMTIESLNKQIEIATESAWRWLPEGVPVEHAVNARGEHIIAPLIVAKANALAALANLKDKE